jgi:preprotein translocase subunit SecD
MSFTEDDLRAALAGEADTQPAPDVWPRLQRRIVKRRRVRAGLAVVCAGAAAAAMVLVLPHRNDDTARLPVTHGGPSLFRPDHPISDAQLATAVDVLRKRLDALGAANATIATLGHTLKVEAPTLSSATLTAVTKRGVLQFRPVLAQRNGVGSAGPSGTVAIAGRLADAEHVFAKRQCDMRSDGLEPPPGPGDSYLVACDTVRGAQLLLGPAALDNGDVSHARAVDDTASPDRWLVTVSLNPTGAQKFFTLTNDVAGKPDPAYGDCEVDTGCNAIAILLDGAVLAAPSVQGSGGIRGGQTQIAGDFAEGQARVLAAMLRSGAMPMSFTADG